MRGSSHRAQKEGTLTRPRIGLPHAPWLARRGNFTRPALPKAETKPCGVRIASFQCDTLALQCEAPAQYGLPMLTVLSLADRRFTLPRYVVLPVFLFTGP